MKELRQVELRIKVWVGSWKRGRKDDPVEQG